MLGREDFCRNRSSTEGSTPTHIPAPKLLSAHEAALIPIQVNSRLQEIFPHHFAQNACQEALGRKG